MPATAPAALVGWCVYDFGVHAWPVVVNTFVWGVYFTGSIATNPEAGTAAWGAALAAAGVVVAVLGPVLGAVADHAGRRKPWLAAFTFLCVAATALLWFSTPRPALAGQTLALVALGGVAYELGVVFYNAMLRDLAPPALLGRLSGWGWGLGYLGGLACLSLALFVLVLPPDPPFGLAKAAAEPVRATALLAALWIALFALPLFALLPERRARCLGLARAVRTGLGNLYATLRRLPGEGSLPRFLLARMIYVDGLNTLFAFGGIYAAGTIGFGQKEVIEFGIAMTAVAGLGTIIFAWVDDWIGSKPTIVLALAALIGLGSAILLIHSKPWFWALGLSLGAFVGPAQAASRTLMARFAPPGLEAEMFGLYALTGRITAFMGPALFGWATAHFLSQRAGMASVVAFLIVGLSLLLTVRAPR